jgi:hypothetical protein
MWPRGYPLVDRAAGDDLHVVHTRADQVSDGSSGHAFRMQQVVEWADVSGATMQDGVPLSVSGAFETTLPRTGTLSIDHTPFNAGYDATILHNSLNVELLAHPGSAPVGASGFGASAVVLGVRVSALSGVPLSGTTTVRYSYADPFPASWKRSIAIDDIRFRLVRLTATVLGIGGGYVQRSEYAGAIEVAPRLAFPAGVTVAGVEFDRGGAIAFDGQSPVVVRWNPVHGAQLYDVTLAHGSSDARRLATTVVMTADTSLTLPAAMFVPGAVYQFVVQAIQTPIDYRTGTLQIAVEPLALAGIPSARFRFLPSCGDGVMQAGEDCDTRGESATCNSDCTSSVCGDGVINAAAGEQCDAINESTRCTKSCKLP